MSEKIKILALDILLNQVKDRRVPANIVKRIYKEYASLKEQEELGSCAVKAYLKNQNGKEMQGVSNVWKYRLSDGDRMLYTYGKYLKYIRSEDADSIVLIGYSEHEKQGEFAKKFNFGKTREYAYVHDLAGAVSILSEDADLTDDELYAIAEIMVSPDYSNGHSIYVLKDEEMKDLSDEELEVYLSNEQDECLLNFSLTPQPTLLQGGAGTGKTLIAVHILSNFNNSNEGAYGVYFTQSNALLENAKGKYNVLDNPDNGNQIDFCNINRFCIDMLNKSEENLVGTFQFTEFIMSRPRLADLCAKTGISPIDVWTEIRGTIKGGMPANWQRTKPMSQDHCHGSIESLVKKGYFVRRTDNKKSFVLGDTVERIRGLANEDTLSDKERENLDSALKYFSCFDSNVRTMLHDDYIKLSESDAAFSAEKREVIWKICEEYEAYLKDSNKFDDNDLVRMMFADRQIMESTRYDLVVVDEIQDYTELQIYLLKALCSNKEKIVFVGDGNQNVNPTAFNESHIQALFRTEQGENRLNKVYLRKNFRCQKNVVDKANKLAALRREKIGKQSAENEQPETALRDGELPCRLPFSADNLSKLSKELSVYPMTAILVPDEFTKQYVLDCLYDGNPPETQTVVFTVAEIKGMEFSYVLCFNLIGGNKAEWNEITSGKSKHSTKYRYYFNLVYVAITRARRFLCFVDEETNPELERVLQLKSVSSFGRNELYLDMLADIGGDWLNAAVQFENNGSYREALQIYTDHDGDAVSVYRCRAHIAIEEHRFAAGVRYALLAGEYGLAEQYSKELKKPDKALSDLCKLWCALHTGGSISFKRKGISDLFNAAFGDMSAEERNRAFSALLKLYGNALLESCDNLKTVYSSYT